MIYSWVLESRNISSTDEHTLLQNTSVAMGVCDFSNGHLVTRVYSGSLVMPSNRLSLL
jgi:hypothetical protein